MTEHNDIDKLDGMIKIKGKCGYEFIGGCKELRDLKQENTELKEKNEALDKLTGIFSHRLLEKYKQALEEIREFAKQQVDCYISMDIDSTPAYEWEDVVNKINEVLK